MNSPVSEIWQHGVEHRLAGDLSEKFWRCNHCNRASVYAIQGGTNSAIRHLRKKHRIKIGKEKDERLVEGCPIKSFLLPGALPPFFYQSRDGPAHLAHGPMGGLGQIEKPI
jgi:hypothetical protein